MVLFFALLFFVKNITLEPSWSTDREKSKPIYQRFALYVKIFFTYPLTAGKSLNLAFTLSLLCEMVPQIIWGSKSTRVLNYHKLVLLFALSMSVFSNENVIQMFYSVIPLFFLATWIFIIFPLIIVLPNCWSKTTQKLTLIFGKQKCLKNSCFLVGIALYCDV